MQHKYMTDSPAAATLTRVELAMVRAIESFSRWCVFLHQSVSEAGLTAQDVWLLHSIRMRGAAQNLSELLLFLNRNDVSTLQYTLRKLEDNGLVERVPGKSKRETGYRMTDLGIQVTDRYAQARSELLVHLIEEVKDVDVSMRITAAALERLTGAYDQATQAVLNRSILES